MESLSVRRAGELVLPGIAIGLLAGAMAGLLAAVGGLSLGYVLATTVALGVPMAAAGAVYDWLLVLGRVRLGGAAPMAVFWLAAFPLCRLVHEVTLDLLVGEPVGLPDALLPFLVFQALLSTGFAVGFLWLHEHVGPYWWLHIRDRNPVAAGYVAQFKRQAVREKESKAARDKRRKESARS